ncbi:hypothetical protein PN497_02475 [Sphaerospermopsis kisseleviana CS-549]|uniref:Uncharacterized protein n=2 Tax=Sphaerospermopsis TaxID=752201 RepID=A0A480A747_9CYAN|nr:MULTISPECIES: hypothetical protein [Sphaerospermopsis]MBD2132618.1 hypothetical protein [Sphaerospermopsis sp. FACHB-1094]MDB9440250.1 hypothetical protein [Sphaerospermopsis kisseleviana CS-549]BAZ83620.1 hypothetical protein NIES73_49090 [Sphaerospermopsis kisseleviana NIES-73]GCL39138.1 hypothetical protein SR1949_42600 [Sphaerospermopsis reniformis]
MPKRSPKSKSSPTSENVTKWLTVTYQPVSLFSLKRSDATSMAARSNLVPTPYAIKMALLKVLLESQGRQHLTDFDAWIKTEFTWIRDLIIYVCPPEKLVVNRNGYKLRYYDQTADKADKTRPTLPMQDGFVFREWVHLQGHLQICCSAGNRLSEIERLFSQINYFGKKGCFFQYLPDCKQETSEPLFQPNLTTGFTIQPMDDLGEKTTFNRINPFSTDKAQLGKDRVMKSGFLPLKLVATSARYDIYHRY